MTSAAGGAGRAPRVLFIVSQPFFEWRGSPIRVGFDLQALVELGHEVTLLTLPFGMEREVPGVRIVRAPRLFGARRIDIGPSLLKLLYDALFLLIGFRLCRRGGFAAIHGVEDAAFPAALLASLFGCRFVYEKHSDPRSYRGGAAKNLVMSLYGLLERAVIGRADAVVATGPGLVDQVRRARPRVPVHHVFDIPSSLREADPARAAEIGRRWRRAPDEVLALYVGSFAAYQGVDLLFEAIPLAVGLAPKLRFVIVGGSEEQIARRRAALAARGAADAVLFAGLIAPDELPDHLAAVDVLISPRIAGRNTPLKILDYLKAARAIVATDTEANRLLLDERTALLVPAEPRALAAGVARLAGDRALRERLAAAAGRLIAGRYNFAAFTRLIGACYRDALAGRGRR